MTSDSPSIALNAKLAIDGKREVITGSQAGKANPLLTRNYRKPFVVPSEKNV